MCRKLIYSISLAMLLSIATSVQALTFTTADGIGADTYISNDNQSASYRPDSTHGGDGSIRVRNLVNTRLKIGYLRFDITGVGGDMTGATLTMDATYLKGGAKVLNVYGLTDETLDSWDEGTICYNNAPGMLPPTPAYGNYTIDPTKLTLLGTITAPDVSVGVPAVFTSTTTALPLDSFIRADTNKLLTLVLIAQGDCEDEFATKENTNAALLRPTLTLPNASVGPTTSASKPKPANTDPNQPRDVVLTWTPGAYAAKHNVYFGTSFAEVDAATTDNHPNVQLSLNQDPNTYDPPGLLTLNQTYYWRVDEVNAPPNTSTFFKGPVWSFTVEPPAFRMSNITATTNSRHNADMDAGKTVDNSGITTANDQHGTTDTTMWLSDIAGPQPTWIKYQFDKIYKLQEMWVWNSNQSIETSIGYGLKSVTIEYSTDGTNFTQLSGVPEFARAPGNANCVHQTVSLGGVAAKYIKITANSNWGGLVKQYGLSEVRFFYIPVQAREPNPTNAQTDVALDAVLRWRAGRDAATHKLYFSTNRKAVVDGTIAPTSIPVSGSYASYGPLSLDLGKTYYWKVDEVNNTTTWPGDVWSFTTAGFLVVDNFEDYNNSSPKRIFQTWLDGVGYSADQYFPVAYPGNGSNAAVGHDIWAAGTTYTNIMETTIIHGDRQSMPMDYNNVKSPYYSETIRTYDTPQDWTKGNAKALTIWFLGVPVAFMETSPGNIVMSGMGTDIYGTADQGRFAYKQLSGDGSIIARVDSVANTDPWAKAGVMIRSTLDAGSAYAFLLMAPESTPHYGCRFQLRSTTGGSATSDTAVTTLAAVRTPHWVKLERVGTTFTAYDSNNPATEGWHPLAWGPQTITMTANVYIGLAVTSHQASITCEGRFSNVSTSANVTGQWQPTDLGVAQPRGNTAAPLYADLQDSNGKIMTVLHPDPNAVQRSPWQEWNIPLSQFTGVNLRSVKKMYIGVGLGMKASGTGSLYFDDIRLYPARCLPLVQKPAADINSDCAVDYLDLDVMVDQWLMTAPPARTADLNADNKVDLKDFAKLAQGWLEEILWP